MTADNPALRETTHETPKGGKQNLDWKKYKLRQCKSVHFCELCRKDIKYGQHYYDGGYGRRVHQVCVSIVEGM